MLVLEGEKGKENSFSSFPSMLVSISEGSYYMFTLLPAPHAGDDGVCPRQSGSGQNVGGHAGVSGDATGGGGCNL